MGRALSLAISGVLFFGFVFVISAEHASAQPFPFRTVAPTPTGAPTPTARPSKTPSPTPTPGKPGSLDTTFGTNGIAVTSFTNTDCGTMICNAELDSAVLQSDDKIVVATQPGNSASQVALVRYLSNGSIDASFGAQGLAGSVGIFGEATTLQTDGKIVIAAMVSGPEFEAARYNPDGTPDQTFGTNGLGTSPHLSGGVGVGLAVLEQTDGKILMAGTLLEGYAGTPRTGLARFNSDGTPDSTFGIGGSVSTASTIGANAIAELSDGEILVAGGSGIAQFTSTGDLESSVTGGTIVVSSPGGVFTSNGNFFEPTSVGVAKDVTDAEVFEFDPTGTTDPAFNNLKFAWEPGGRNQANAIAIQPNGAVVVAGEGAKELTGPDSVYGLARLEMNGNLDPTFGSGGLVSTQIDGQGSGWGTVLIQSNGNIVTVGTAPDPSNPEQTDLALARYLAN
jgi:uncharacterized delta-60 repeat protein